MTHQPRMSLPAIWNMSFGFLGIQFGWGLQMANMSAIYQFLGADASKLPILWLAAPVTGLIVQPIIGYYSDRTWTRLGRRRPYFLVGAIFASLALIAMPNSSTLWMAAGLLWILDASVNVSMEPFRAFVGDMLPEEQRKVGFSMQSLLIGLGAVMSMSLPWVLSNVFGVDSSTSDSGNAIPWTVHLSFYIGSGVFFLAVLYTIITTKEYPPEDLEKFEAEKRRTAGVGAAFREIVSGFFGMPKLMKRLAVVQFFTWLGLFCMWIYFTPAISARFFDPDTTSEAYLKGVEWGGLMMAVYNGVAFGFAFVLIWLVQRVPARTVHAACLIAGGVGLFSVGVLPSAEALIVSMVLVGIAWASILALPYAMLSNVLPADKMGFFMGVFNYFIVLPQILAATLLGPVVNAFFDGKSMPIVMGGGLSMLLAAVLLVMLVPKSETA